MCFFAKKTQHMRLALFVFLILCFSIPVKSEEGFKIKAGHTDNVGGAVINQKLSEARAKTVRDYLIENGMLSDRLSYKGYGKSQHIAPNISEMGMRQNRRIEIKVLKSKTPKELN